MSSCSSKEKVDQVREVTGLCVSSIYCEGTEFTLISVTFRLCLVFLFSFEGNYLFSSMSSNSVNGFVNPPPNGDYTPLRAQFPDGIKVSGQHSPCYDELRSYENFPEEITGPTVWKAEEYQDSPERWTHQLTEQEIKEISEAADNFKAAGIPLLDISKVFSKVGSLHFVYADRSGSGKFCTTTDVSIPRNRTRGINQWQGLCPSQRATSYRMEQIQDRHCISRTWRAFR